MEEISIIAWWGAIVATLVLIWDLYKFVHNKAIIRSNIKLNIHYPDGEILSEEKLENGTVVRDLHSYCHIELINIGTMPTTLMDILISSFSDNAEVGIGGKAITPHFGKKIPTLLSPGEVWSGRLKMETLKNLKKNGSPILKAYFSHLKNPIQIRIYK